MKTYEVHLIQMRFDKDNGSTADSTEWATEKPDFYNILVTEHANDDSGMVELVLDIDFAPEMAGLAPQMLSIVTALAEYANHYKVPFGTTVNPHS